MWHLGIQWLREVNKKIAHGNLKSNHFVICFLKLVKLYVIYRATQPNSIDCYPLSFNFSILLILSKFHKWLFCNFV